MKNYPFFVALAVTVLWLSVVYWWLISTPIEPEPVLKFFFWGSDYDQCTLWRFLCPVRTLTLNEAGDFLAGTFAVLAFLWLAAAVILQGAELARQRDEFTASRRAMEAQTESMLENARRMASLQEDERLIDEVQDVLSRYATTWPSEIILKPPNLGALGLPHLDRRELLRGEADGTFRNLSRKLRSHSEKLRFADRVQFSENFDGLRFSGQLAALRIELAQILEKQEVVSERYIDSPFFSEALVFLEFCTVLYEKMTREKTAGNLGVDLE